MEIETKEFSENFDKSWNQSHGIEECDCDQCRKIAGDED